MEVLIIGVSALTGVLIYRLGRREGEAGQVIPLRWRRSQIRREDALLDKIERYKGKRIETERK